MVSVPGGCFQMGSNKGYEDPNYMDETPPHKHCVDSFYLDKYEASNAEFKKWWDATGGTPAELMPLDHPVASNTRQDYYTNPAYADYPAVSMTWFHARDFCKDQGKRLPTEAELEYALRGKRSLDYGQGNAAFDKQNANAFNPSGDTLPVKDGVPAWSGAYHLGDNVGEWTSDCYNANAYQHVGKTGHKAPNCTPSVRSVVLGKGMNFGVDVPFTATTKLAEKSNSFNDRTGIRCAKDDSSISSTSKKMEKQTQDAQRLKTNLILKKHSKGH